MARERFGTAQLSRPKFVSIPACARYPNSAREWPGSLWGYPRLCGVFPRGITDMTLANTLSPLMRGIPADDGDDAAVHRATPDHAGNP